MTVDDPLPCLVQNLIAVLGALLCGFGWGRGVKKRSSS